MNTKEKKLLYKVALNIAEILVCNGSEISRANDTALRICSAYGYKNVPLFISPTVIILGDSEDDSSYYLIKNINSRNNNISKINYANALSRDIVNKTIDLESALKKIDEIDNLKSYSYPCILFNACLGCAVFTLMLGGTVRDFIVSIFTSAITFVINDYITGLSKTPFLGNFLASMSATIAALLLVKAGIGENVNMIVVGSILPLVPGVAFTSGIRDFLSGDLISGTARTFEAVFVGIAIAFGVGSMLMLASLIGGF